MSINDDERAILIEHRMEKINISCELRDPFVLMCADFEQSFYNGDKDLNVIEGN